MSEYQTSELSCTLLLYTQFHQDPLVGLLFAGRSPVQKNNSYVYYC